MELGFGDDVVMIVRGDPERLAFAFRSLLGHLLAVRSTDAPFKVSIDVSRGRAFVNIVLTARDSASVVAGLTEASPDGQAAQPDQIARVEFFGVRRGHTRRRCHSDSNQGAWRQAAGHRAGRQGACLRGGAAPHAADRFRQGCGQQATWIE